MVYTSLVATMMSDHFINSDSKKPGHTNTDFTRGFVTVTRHEITCANKNPRGVIVRIGGEGWSLSVHDAIMKLSSNQLRLTLLFDNEVVEVGVRGEGSSAYLVLEPDGQPLHDLEGLPSC